MMHVVCLALFCLSSTAVGAGLRRGLGVVIAIQPVAGCIACWGVTLVGVSIREPGSRFSTFAEWNEHLRASPDRRRDDTPVIGGQKGRPRRATHEELLELIRRCEAEEAVGSGSE